MNHDIAWPGSVRPGGRTARVRESVLQVAGDLLADRGFAQLDLTEIAATAGVGKTTVYRRWRTPAGLVADLLVDMAETSLPRSDAGSLLDDLTANARLVAQTLADPRQGNLFRAVIAAATADELTATALHTFYDTRLTEWAPCVAAAVERGEAPPGTDPRAVLSAVSAPLYYRLLASGDPIDEAAADQSARAATLATIGGAFVR
ncbi:TetR/AcrR family transcriptional regulator [Nocardia asteroides]|uniref:TetR family transcriptional regulator n=1 Tax=Nocardia asteroides NBRC 15531 TaxID=1110697 RepID=U5EBG0_NOCAS|nr:TetR/AcrR family transcriptional regulator [Nocardia asteroides]TLF69674.1 TetR/AcrR family transcriptional regulator [Nocardia asteroides NBRC 15531]UGT49178.1 TetR/AcrR family transcriptional regulator [Nocardia asteroides]SFL82711.1 transcriptional regulator, TetR family [Nocardia asteroides]VEG31028.1 Bacterial regulatory proteins, tetR family [Nocardia asteroides]GAD83751.1 putative TetR family transcriptional regulator [Nocardia asteroides NBRC 15531]